MVARLSGRADVSGLVRIGGQRLRFDISYDTTGHARYRVDDAAAEALMTPGRVLARFPRMRAVHLCASGSAQAQASLAGWVRERPGGGEVLLSATTFRNRILAEPCCVHRLAGMLDVLVCSAEDACLLTGAGGLAAAIGALRPKPQGPWLVCVTDGPRGAHVLRRGHPPRMVCAPRVRAADPTGAGESFAGALAAGLAVGRDPLAAAATAARVAAITVTGWGPDALLAADPAAASRRGRLTGLGWRR